MKSMNNLLLLGDGETWARQRVDFAGLPEMVRTILQVAAGAADIPVTPAGLPRRATMTFLPREISTGTDKTLRLVSDSKTEAAVTTIYIQLLDEGTTTYRPAEGRPLGGDIYEVLATPRYDPEDEVWEFLPGSVVRCVLETKRDGPILIARHLAERG